MFKLPHVRFCSSPYVNKRTKRLLFEIKRKRTVVEITIFRVDGIHRVMVIAGYHDRYIFSAITSLSYEMKQDKQAPAGETPFRFDSMSVASVATNAHLIAPRTMAAFSTFPLSFHFLHKSYNMIAIDYTTNFLSAKIRARTSGVVSTEDRFDLSRSRRV